MLIFIDSAKWQALVDAVAGTRTDVANLHRMVARNLLIIEQKEDSIMNTLDDVVADITDLSSKEDGLIALTTSIKSQLDAALAGALTPAQQAKVDAIFGAVEARKTAIVTAINANTPTGP